MIDHVAASSGVSCARFSPMDVVSAVGSRDRISDVSMSSEGDFSFYLDAVESGTISEIAMPGHVLTYPLDPSSVIGGHPLQIAFPE